MDDLQVFDRTEFVDSLFKKIRRADRYYCRRHVRRLLLKSFEEGILEYSDLRILCETFLFLVVFTPFAWYIWRALRFTRNTGSNSLLKVFADIHVNVLRNNFSKSITFLSTTSF